MRGPHASDIVDVGPLPHAIPTLIIHLERSAS